MTKNQPPPSPHHRPPPPDYPTLFGCPTGADGDVVVLGAPYDRGTPSEHAGCASAPAALRRVSAPSSCRADRHGLYDLARRDRLFSRAAVTDLGDIRFHPQSSDDAYLSKITDAARILTKEGKRPLVLGGDHVITLAILRGIAQARAGKPFQVVQLDAHQDIEHVEPHERPTHGSFIAHVVTEKLAERIIQVGVRGYSWGEHDCASLPNVVSLRGVDSSSSWSTKLAATLLHGVDTYLTIDTDGFDPGLAGAVNFPEHEGLTLADLDIALERIASVASVAGSTLIGADWTEYNPSLDTKNALTGHFIVRGLGKILRALSSSSSSPLLPRSDRC
jgi:arginase family enzyme